MDLVSISELRHLLNNDFKIQIIPPTPVFLFYYISSISISMWGNKISLVGVQIGWENMSYVFSYHLNDDYKIMLNAHCK